MHVIIIGRSAINISKAERALCRNVRVLRSKHCIVSHIKTKENKIGPTVQLSVFEESFLPDPSSDGNEVFSSVNNNNW